MIKSIWENRLMSICPLFWSNVYWQIKDDALCVCVFGRFRNSSDRNLSFTMKREKERESERGASVCGRWSWVQPPTPPQFNALINMRLSQFFSSDFILWMFSALLDSVLCCSVWDSTSRPSFVGKRRQTTEQLTIVWSCADSSRALDFWHWRNVKSHQSTVDRSTDWINKSHTKC